MPVYTVAAHVWRGSASPPCLEDILFTWTFPASKHSPWRSHFLGRSRQRSELRSWPTRQTILNWEMIQWCESLNPFAYFYWTWTHKLNPVHEEMQKGARTWLQDIFPNQNSILLIFFNSLTTSGMLFPAWWILGKWQTVGKETRVEG